MKILLALFALTVAAHAGTFTIWAASPQHAAEFRADKFLDALAAKETGMHPGRVGPRGELSRWQIMPTVWADEMGAEPFAHAADVTRARVCALRRIARIRRLTGDSVERVATCWHYGLTHRGRASVWGQEVANLYEGFSE